MGLPQPLGVPPPSPPRTRVRWQGVPTPTSCQSQLFFALFAVPAFFALIFGAAPQVATEEQKLEVSVSTILLDRNSQLCSH